MNLIKLHGNSKYQMNRKIPICNHCRNYTHFLFISRCEKCKYKQILSALKDPKIKQFPEPGPTSCYKQDTDKCICSHCMYHEDKYAEKQYKEEPCVSCRFRPYKPR